MKSVPISAIADINALSVVDASPDGEIIYADLASVDLEAQKVTPTTLRFSEAPSRARRRVLAGDSLVPYLVGNQDWDRTRPLLVMAHQQEIVFSTGFYTASPRRVDPRFLNYVLSSKPALAFLEARSTGVTMRGFSQEVFSRTPVPDHDMKSQTQIADFLDTETARIDNLITKKRRMIDLLGEVVARSVERVFAKRGVTLPSSVNPDEVKRMLLPEGWRIIRLGATLRQLTNGYVGPTRDILRDEGVRYVQGLHLKGGGIDFHRRPYFVDSDWHAARPRTALRAGDVVIVQTGDIGRCAVVPDGFGEANCHALLIARPNRMVVSPEYLGTYLQCDFGYRSLVRVATGALHPHLEFGIRDVLLVVPPTDEQTVIWEAVKAESDRLETTISLIAKQISFLRSTARR